MTAKSYLLMCLISFCSLTLFAEGKLAIIDDPEGFTNIRKGPGKSFIVVDTLYKDDFFYFEFIDNSEWAKITAWKVRQIEGFIHKSRIQAVEDLALKKQKELISKILDKQRTLAYNFQKAFTTKDSLAYRLTVKELEYYNDTKYDPILPILSKYFCSTSDIEILQLFFSTIWADKGSANETPSFSIGDCFICKPHIVIDQLLRLKNIEQKKLLFDQIEWGLLNHFEVDENGFSKNKEFIKLKALLDNERKKSLVSNI